MIKSREELNSLREQYQASLQKEKKQVLICGGTGCVACGSMAIYDRFIEVLNERGLDVNVKLVEEPEDHERCAVSMKISGCHGFCECGPLVRIEPEGWLYIKTTVEDVEEIIEKWESYRGRPQELNLPSAPKQFIHYFRENDRPQIKSERNLEGGMAVSVGRLRPDTQYDVKFVSMSHNTLRGAAGGAVLMAELLCAEGYLD